MRVNLINNTNFSANLGLNKNKSEINGQSPILNIEQQKLVDKYDDSRACAQLSKEEIIKAQNLTRYYNQVKAIYDKLDASSAKVDINKTKTAVAIYDTAKNYCKKDEAIEALTSNINGLIKFLDEETPDDKKYTCDMNAFYSPDNKNKLHLFLAQVQENNSNKTSTEAIYFDTVSDETNDEKNNEIDEKFELLKLQIIK